MSNPLIPGADANSGIMYSVRDEPPSHYTFKIDQFSLVPELLLAMKLDKHESKEFTASGYKWNLSLYPEGDNKRGGSNHISLYLTLSKNNTLPPGWELDVVFTFFVYNHNDNNYVTIQDGKIWRLHEVRRECGFAKLLTLPAFSDIANGYLSEDSCAFGVEIFVIKSEGRSEHLSINEDPDDGTFSVTIPNFFGSKETQRDSALHTVSGLKWRIRVFPNGFGVGNGKFVSIYLRWEDTDPVRKGKKLLVKYSLSIKDQVNRKSETRQYTKWLGESLSNWGTPEFMAISDMKGKKGFLVNDTCIVEAKITFISEISDA